MGNRVLVTYASRHGATEGIAERIASVLRTNDIVATVMPVEAVRDAGGYDAYVIGSAVYATHWLGSGKAFVHRNHALLRRHPVWLFSSGPLSSDPGDLTAATPRDATGIERDVEARGHRVFAGAWDRDAKPIGFLEKAVRLFPAAHDALPEADYRDWPAIESYAASVAGELTLALETD